MPKTVDVLEEIRDLLEAQGNGGGGVYQPLDSDLTAIAALATTAYGRALLELAGDAALRAAAGVPGQHPADHNLLGWTCDPMAAASQVGLTNAWLQIFRVVAAADGLVQNIIGEVVAAGATLTANQCYIGLCAANGNRLAVSGDMSGVWASTGRKDMALTSGVQVTRGTTYYVVTVCNGTTMPQFRRATSSAVLTNVGLTTAAPRFANISGVYSAIPANVPVTTGALASNSVFFGLAG